MAGWMISRKVIGPSERPMRFSHPRLSASSTIHLPGWAPLNGTYGLSPRIDPGLSRFFQAGASACIRTAGHEEPPDSWVQGDIAHPSNGELRVRSPQLARSKDDQLEIPPQADAARLSRSRSTVPLRLRAEDRLQQWRGPHSLVIVPGHVDGLLEGDRAPQRQPRAERHHECGDGITGQMLPVADPDRLGECQPLGSERLLGHLEAVERGIVQAELEVEWHLLLEDRTAVADHAGDVAAVLGLQSLDAHGSDAVEHPDLERHQPDAVRRAVVDHGRSVLDGDDPGMRERAIRRPGDEPAQGEDAAHGPGIAEPEDDVSLPEHVPAPAVPPGHLRVHRQWQELSGRPGPARGRTPETARPGGRSHPVGPFLQAPLIVPERDHPAAEPEHGQPPGASRGARARASCTVPEVDTTRGDLRASNPHRRSRRRGAREVDVGTKTIPPFSGHRRGRRLSRPKALALRRSDAHGRDSGRLRAG